jgi:hypothetical protein
MSKELRKDPVLNRFLTGRETHLTFFGLKVKSGNICGAKKQPRALFTAHRDGPEYQIQSLTKSASTRTHKLG